MATANPEDLIVSIRKQCLAKGLAGLKGLAVVFRGMDKDYSKTLCFQEFKEGIQRYGIKLSDPEIKIVFDHLDTDSSGTVDFAEVLLKLRPPMPACRVAVVNEAFHKLDVIKDGLLKVEDLKIVYKENAMQHPKYLAKEWSLDQVLVNFLDTFDSPEDKDGMVTLEEFLQYYGGVSSTIDDDMYFDLMMRSCWGLPERGAAKTKEVSDKPRESGCCGDSMNCLIL